MSERVYTKEKFERDIMNLYEDLMDLAKGVRHYSIAEFYSTFGIRLPYPETYPDPEFKSYVPPPAQRYIPDDMTAQDITGSITTILDTHTVISTNAIVAKLIIFTKERWRWGFEPKTVWRHGNYIIG